MELINVENGSSGWVDESLHLALELGEVEFQRGRTMVAIDPKEHQY